jgi:type IV pilus assembly protein PilA
MNSALRAYRDEEQGFTLIELLVVVIIIGILAAIAIPAFLNQRENAYVSSAESDARNAAIEIESDFTRNGVYPADQAAFDALGVETSQNVTLTYTLDAGGAAYTIVADHSLTAPADDATYDSDAGGLQ